ncbi:hypothetical protein AURDEDRAFT_178202 [Auricularia subglabra TFB-10046 SS5]|uniref:Uncharacterized protein n=1 Tax=Auricularia subglabra (strain TFB-10046 / SS5) TaxID=717982 RepID=J0WLN7_AURST|nr:hypothetical protein AURDEDRAFT_178202 [Auricularia subglabra TFB-10046 SS5]
MSHLLTKSPRRSNLPQDLVQAVSSGSGRRLVLSTALRLFLLQSPRATPPTVPPTQCTVNAQVPLAIRSDDAAPPPAARVQPECCKPLQDMLLSKICCSTRSVAALVGTS